MTKQLDADHALALFLGDGPAIVAGSASTPGDECHLRGLPDRSVGSILVRIGPRESDASSMRALLVDCHRVLRDDGRLAVSLGNRLWQVLARLRARLRPGLGGPPAASDASGRISLRTLLQALDGSGYDDVATFVAPQGANEPSEIRRPSSRADLLFAPSFLVTAGKSGAVATSVIRRIADRVLRGGTESSLPTPTIVRVTNSARGKSIAFVENGPARSVIRIPRSDIARLDESLAHALLRDLRAEARVGDLVAAPLLSGMEGGHMFFAESHVEGHPLARRLTSGNRVAYVVEVERVLKALNPDLERRPAMPLHATSQGAFFQPMLERVLAHLGDAALRADARALVEDSLRGAHSRLGIVHGDFGASNILESGGRITAIVDWEAARRAEPPVLDAFNYLDSAHRTCNANVTLGDTMELLVRGQWPVPEERDFLERSLHYCGIDERFRGGFALLYLVYHIGPQLRFTDRETGPVRRLELVFRRLLA